MDLPSPAGFPTRSGPVPEESRKPDIFVSRRPSPDEREPDILSLSRAAPTVKRPEPAGAPAREESGWDAAARTRDRGIPASASHYFEEGLAMLRRGDQPGALALWEQALALEPENRIYQSNVKRLKRMLEPSKRKP
jgi:hypothetical protein